MKIKYKLIIMFILIILFASLPLSLFILHKQEQEKISDASLQGNIYSTILTRTVLNVILANGGEIKPTQIDMKEMLKVFNTLANFGLIYADAFLISSKKEYNGLLLAEYYVGRTGIYFRHTGRKIPGSELDRIMHRNVNGMRKINLPDLNDVCYEFTAVGSLPGKPPMCVGRLIFSQATIVAPIKKLHKLIWYSIVTAIVIVGLVGLYFSRFISKPIEALISATRSIEGGDFSHRIPVRTNDELGRLSGTFNNMIGIIDQKIGELEQANERLTQLDGLKDEFLANISHELRTPLYGIVGISESLMKGATGPLNDETNHDLSLIISSGKRLSGLVDDILDFSQLKHHDIVLTREPVDMHDVVQLVISIVRPMLESKPLVIYNAIRPGEAIVDCDKNRIQQIMLNLVGNAVLYTKEGSVTISAAGCEGDDDKLEITVADTGIGIDPGFIDRIFESFTQADRPDSGSHGSAGLGLAITKKLVELHGGTIRVESEPGKGSEFTFTLDRARHVREKKKAESGKLSATREVYRDSPATVRTTLDSLIEVDDADRKKILVVDDDPVNLQVIVNHLALEGYTVITARDGEEVFALLEGDIPDLIILDVMLPRMSGFDICRTIRERHPIHELPIIMLTAKKGSRDIVTGLSAGANDYLTKPVYSDELIARVKSLISMKVAGKMQHELNIFKIQMDIATDIQKAIVPHDIPHLERIKFGVLYELSELVGGDLYDYHLIDDMRIAVLVADAAGHGIPAAMVSSMLQVAYTFHKADFTNPPVLFNKVNAIMSKYTHGVYLTACCVYIDLNVMKLYHSNAGHRPLLIWRRNERRLISDKIYDRPIGIWADTSYSVNELEIQDGDRILLYTDGIIEARNSAREIFGEERFHSLIRDEEAKSVEDFSSSVIDAVKQWAGIKSGESLVDDITMIVMDISLHGNES
jgi:two-component system sensor histidine kinase ChiS